MHQPYHFSATCPECGTEIPATITKGYPPIISGPADNWDPGSPDEVDAPDICPNCESALDYDDLVEQGLRAERMRDRQYED